VDTGVFNQQFRKRQAAMPAKRRNTMFGKPENASRFNNGKGASFERFCDANREYARAR
jgi:hypothetical protein